MVVDQAARSVQHKRLPIPGATRQTDAGTVTTHGSRCLANLPPCGQQRLLGAALEALLFCHVVRRRSRAREHFLGQLPVEGTPGLSVPWCHCVSFPTHALLLQGGFYRRFKKEFKFFEGPSGTRHGHYFGFLDCLRKRSGEPSAVRSLPSRVPA